MCAYGVLAVAPNVTLLDYPLLLGRPTGEHTVSATIGEMMRGYWVLIWRWALGAIRRPRSWSTIVGASFIRASTNFRPPTRGATSTIPITPSDCTSGCSPHSGLTWFSLLAIAGPGARVLCVCS